MADAYSLGIAEGLWGTGTKPNQDPFQAVAVMQISLSVLIDY